MYKVTSYNAYRLKTEQIKEFEEFKEAEEYARSMFKTFQEELDHYDFNVVVEGLKGGDIIYEPAATRIGRIQREIMFFLNNKTEEEQKNFKEFLEEMEEELHDIKLSLMRKD